MGFAFDSCTSEDLLVQQRRWSNGRLRREDCEFVKHDKLFSSWKILVGPSDWSEHSAGKDGIDRYHFYNLPASHFGPGVYELGVTAPSWPPTSHRQRTRTLNKEDVMAVYVGQADNIRQRLQKYGRAGSHLEGSRSSKLYQGDDDSVPGGSSSSGTSRSLMAAESGSKQSNNGPRLFSEVFAFGSSIAFRWAHTDSKVVAEQVESELLAVFDYAWNKGSNGNRRSRDILSKLFMAWPTHGSYCGEVFSGKKWLFCGTNAVGIKVALRRPQDTSSKPNKSVCHLLTAPPPQLPVSDRTPVKVASLELRCGVITDKGVPCNIPPVRGRKRCLQHKGMRVRGVPAAGQPPRLATNETKFSDVNRGSMKRESVKVGGGSSCLPKAFLGRQSSLLTKAKTDHCTHVKTECRTRCKEEPGERRRPLSLSFNTWMKMENERVHDSLDSTWTGSTDDGLEITFQKAIMQELPHSGMTAIPRRRVRQIGSKYTSVPGDDSKRR